MRVFRQVVESGTFVAAAERLDLSTAMTSKHVMHMEQRLRTRLLNRSSRSLSLTEAGRLFFERCKIILDEVEEAEYAVGSVSDAPRGMLRVTCPSWAAASGRFGDVLLAYRKRCPEVIVDISFEDRFVDLIEEGYDLALRCTAGSPPGGLIARSLRPMPFVLAGSPEYLKRCGAPSVPEDLARHDCIMLDTSPHWHLSTPKGTIEASPRIVLRARSATAAAHAARAGVGLAPVPLPLLEEPTFREDLRPVLLDYPLEQPTLYAVYVSRKHVPPKIRTFIDHVIEHVPKVPLQGAAAKS
jgi:DNA-binding transcriptional LysR family regulator